MNKYILDTNIFITAKNNWYPFDIFPSFWDKLLEKAKNEEFYISSEIYEELKAGDDELADWIEENKSYFKILPSDTSNLITCYSEIIQSVVDNEIYKESAKEEFARVADSWLIAHAMNNNLTIVTQEVQVDLNCKSRVKIPNVCSIFNIECIDVIEFMRRTSFRF
jgi:predicted nucleic acid-binding protein